MLLLERVTPDTETQPTTLVGPGKAAVLEHRSVMKMIDVTVWYCLSLGRVVGTGDITPLP